MSFYQFISMQLYQVWSIFESINIFSSLYRPCNANQKNIFRLTFKREKFIRIFQMAF